MQTELRSLATQQYKERMKERLDLPPTIEQRMMEEKPVTQDDFDAINNDPRNYANRERIPEPLLVYSDLYHELTGQEMLKMDITGYIEVFQEWKDRAIQPNDIRGAWAQSKSAKGGFFVGHPRALTVTANGMKSKAMPAMPVLNKASVERTQGIIEQKVELVSKATDIPDAERERMRQWKARLSQKGSAR